MSIIRTVARSIFEEDDDSTYVVPNYLYDNIVKKTNKDKIDLDDVLTMSLELWLHESEVFNIVISCSILLLILSNILNISIITTTSLI